MNKGFTLFIAIIITGTVLLIAAGITGLSVKESLISGTGRESQYAFYAADTGMECALYWDVQNPSGVSAFATSSASQITCSNQNMIVGGSQISTLTFTLSPQPYCVVVTVTKENNGSTRIESRGLNTCDTSNPRRVERAVRASY